jgi:hypothetical protein
LVVGLALAAAMVAGAVVWLGNQSPFERYITPPMNSGKYRLSLLVPRGWTVTENAGSDFARYIKLKPPGPPEWIPQWLRWGPFREPAPADALILIVETDAAPRDDVLENNLGEAHRRTDDYYFSHYRRLKPRAGIYGVSYSRNTSRSTKRDFETTKSAIYNSLRLVE